MFRKFLAIIVGFLAAGLVMSAFELLNFFFFPFPQGMDLSSLEAVRDFARTLPWNAYLLILLGSALGSLVGGLVMRKIARDPASTAVPVIGGLLLTAEGIASVIILEYPLWVIIVGLPMFLAFTMIGYRAKKRPEIEIVRSGENII